MKKTILLMLGMAAMLASCSQDELDTAQGAGTAVITATVDDGIATRSTYEQDDVDITRCLLEVRDAEGNLVGKQHEMTEGTDDTFTFTVRGLDPDETYTYLFWADNGSAYTATDLTAVTMVDEKEAEALAFSGTTTGKPGEISATLTHAVAKVTLKTTGTLYKDDKVKAEISGAAKTLNVLKGEASGEQAYDYETTVPEDVTAGEVMTFYVPASAEGQVADMTITYNSKETGKSPSRDVTNVPLRANYRTLVSGDIANISATDVTTTLSKDNWNDNEGAQLITYVINLETTGKLTEDMLGTAIAQNGGRIVITGKVNQTDMETLFNYLDSNYTIYSTSVSIDMSGATLDDENTVLPGSVQGLSNIESFALPEGITAISDDGFGGCQGLRTVTLPSTLESIGAYAFGGTNLSGEIVIPAGVTHVGRSAFGGLSITSLVWNSDTPIPQKTFGGCSSLTTVTINGNVTSFDSGAFNPCMALSIITFTGVTAVPVLNDSYTYLMKSTVSRIYVPENLVDAFKAAEGWKEYSDKIFPLQ